MSSLRAGRGAGEARIACYTDARAWPGGAEMYVGGLVRSLVEAGRNVCLFTSDRPATGAWVSALRSEGIDVVCYPPHRELDLTAERAAAQMLGGFDVLHVSKPDVRTCLPALFASRRAGVKVVVTTEHVVQRAASRYPLGSAVVAALVRRANRSVDRIITVSEMSRQAYVENYGGDPARVLAIRNGVDLDRFRALPDRAASRQSLGLRREDIVTTVVGRLVPGKGHAAAIESVSALAGRVPRLRLLVVGDGPLASDLARLAAAMRVRDRVVFAGTRHDIDAVLSASDLLLLASEAESLPFAVLEAMAAAPPVVATAVGALAEAVEDGVTGRLVPVGDPDALAGALADVLTSPDRGAAMGIAGRARAEAAFDARSNHRRVAQLYDELLEAAEARHAR